MKGSKEPRDYIGASSIGADCNRQIWYELNGYIGSFDSPKTYLTFMVGKVIEEMLLMLLHEYGFLVSEKWVLDNGIIKGHPDAVLIDKEGSPHLIIEIKTAKDASFNIFKKHGLYRWNRRYYSQIQAYMGLSGIHDAVIIVFNKDTSEIVDEFLGFDQTHYDWLLKKAEMIKSYDVPPERVNKSAFWYDCKICKFKGICYGSDKKVD